jgi:hypothetical protein
VGEAPAAHVGPAATVAAVDHDGDGCDELQVTDRQGRVTVLTLRP